MNALASYSSTSEHRFEYEEHLRNSQKNVITSVIPRHNRSIMMTVAENLLRHSGFHPLNNRGVLLIDGDDAIDFLDRVITCSVASLREGEYRAGALLSPQGKVQTDFLIFRSEDRVYLDTDIDQIEPLTKKLRMLRMRAKVDITTLETQTVLPLFWKPNTALPEFPNSVVFQDPRFIASESTGGNTVYRILLDQRDRSSGETIRLVTSSSRSSYETIRIAAGVPEFGHDYSSQEVFPTDVNLDIYGGIDYNKGCFIGQEVVSRMRRRGTIRKRTVKIVGESIERNAEIRSDTLIGKVTSVSGNNGLACVRVDKLNSVDRYTVNDRLVEIELPPWPGLQI